MKSFAIFGGTGNTGEVTVAHCVEKGYKVNLLYRNIATVKEEFTKNPNINLIEGNVCNKEDVRKTIAGVDAVLVALGTRNKLDPTTEMSDGVKNIIDVMYELNVKRIAIILSSFLFWDQSKVPPRFLNVHNEHLKMWDQIKSSSLEFVVVCPPHIAEKPKTNFTVTPNSTVSREVSKLDLGEFLMDCLFTDDHIGQSVGIAITPA